MEIVSIEPLNKKKCRIVLDNGEQIALYNKEAEKYRLVSGAFLPEEDYEEIIRQILIPRAKRRVLYLLRSMDRTQAQLKGKLQEDFFPEQVIEEAIAYGKSFHYVDDERYARNYASAKLSGKSRRMVALELERKGISKDFIAGILAQIPEEQEEETIIRLIRKKHLAQDETDEEKVIKVKQFLLRKGFTYETINRAISRYMDGK